MITCRLGPRWLFLIAIGVLLIFMQGPAHLAGQISSPPPSHAQVVAQGVQQLNGVTMQWHIRTITIGAINTNPATVLSGGFIVAQEDQIIVRSSSGEMELVSPAQATWIPATAAKEVFSTTDLPTQVLSIALVNESTTDGGVQSESFDVGTAATNLQLTRGVLNPGDMDVFTPVNDLPYIVAVSWGSLEINTAGLDDVEMKSAGNVVQSSGSLELRTSVDQSATYLIAAIGQEILELPDSTPGDGAMLLSFHDCAESALSSYDLSECGLLLEQVPAVLTPVGSDSGGENLTLADAAQLPDGTWLLDNVPVGEWILSLDYDGQFAMQFALVGDVFEMDAGWRIVVQENQPSIVHVLLVGVPGTLERSELTIAFVECPTGWLPDDGTDACDPATSEPNLMIQADEPDGIFRNTMWDAEQLDVGIYRFGALPVGTYVLWLEHNVPWTPAHSTFFGDAYTDGERWLVDVALPDPPSIVLIALVPPIEEASPPVATGSVIIVQNECEATEGECVAAIAPWEVILTNINTGEVYSLVNDAVWIGDGQWQLEISAGGYTVDIPESAGWVMEYPGWVEVVPDQWSVVVVNGYLP